jgi:hypothetical protein
VRTWPYAVPRVIPTTLITETVETKRFLGFGTRLRYQDVEYDVPEQAYFDLTGFADTDYYTYASLVPSNNVSALGIAYGIETSLNRANRHATSLLRARIYIPSDTILSTTDREANLQKPYFGVQYNIFENAAVPEELLITRTDIGKWNQRHYIPAKQEVREASALLIEMDKLRHEHPDL